MEKDGQPGTARFGNFINYYAFNPVEKRLGLIPTDILTPFVKFNEGTSPALVLDIGCNSGDLTATLREHLFSSLSLNDVKILGVDLDPMLIERSRSNHKVNCLTFEVCDLTDPKSRAEVVEGFLAANGKRAFDLVTCFSVTLWVHLNGGDDGLREFLRYVADISRFLIMEPQPWKCYRTAERRMRRNGCATYPKFKELEWRTDVDERISTFLSEECGMTLKRSLGMTQWDRKLLLFMRDSD